MTHWTEEMFVDSPEVFAVTMRRRVEQTAEEVDTLLALLGTHGIEPADALDVACGIGRHAVNLAGTGIDVHGIDISPRYVEAARERAAEAGVEDRARFEVGDMRALVDREGSYDLVTNMWTAFGYFDEEANERVAEGFYERVAADGALVMELANKEGMMADYAESSAQEDDGLLYVERREYTPDTGRMNVRLTLFHTGADADDDSGKDGTGVETRDETEYEPVGELSWDLRLYSPAELRRLLERVGFSEVSLYGSLDGEPLERESARLVVVARP